MGVNTEAPIQQLSCNIAQQQRTQISVLNLDASKFFDHIFLHMAVPTMLCLGAPRSMCIALAKILRNMSHSVRTAHGISPCSIQPMLSNIWSGTGKGGGVSSPICLSVLLPIIQCMTKFAKGINFQDPFHIFHFQAWAIAYIDDVHLITMYKDDSTHANIVLKMQNCFEAWEGLLDATGGALNPTKCHAMEWDWDWDKGNPTALNIHMDIKSVTSQDYVTNTN